MPRFRSIGFMPAATAFRPSRTIAWASTHAVVVPSPAMSLVFWAASRTICAPMFSNLSSSSISLATVTPSLVVRGAPNDLSRIDVAALGPERDLHGVGENVDAAQHALAGIGGEFDVFGSHVAFSSCNLVVASELRVKRSAASARAFACRALAAGRLLLEDPHDVALLHDEEFLRRRS